MTDNEREQLREIADELDKMNREATANTVKPGANKDFFKGEAAGYANAEAMVRALLEAEEESGATERWKHGCTHHCPDHPRPYNPHDRTAPEPEPEEGEPDTEYVLAPTQWDDCPNPYDHEKRIEALERRVDNLEEAAQVTRLHLSEIEGKLSTPEPDSEPEPMTCRGGHFFISGKCHRCGTTVREVLDATEPERDEGGEGDVERIVREEMTFLLNWHFPRQRLPDETREQLGKAVQRTLARLRSRPSEEGEDDGDS